MVRIHVGLNLENKCSKLCFKRARFTVNVFTWCRSRYQINNCIEKHLHAKVSYCGTHKYGCAFTGKETFNIDIGTNCIKKSAPVERLLPCGAFIKCCLFRAYNFFRCNRRAACNTSEPNKITGTSVDYSAEITRLTNRPGSWSRT